MTIPPPPESLAPAAPVPAAAPRRGLRTAGIWALSAVLVVGAWGLTQVQQPDDAPYDRFVTSTTVGKRGEARNIAVTVTDIRAGHAVSDGDRWRADGTWLVVDLDAATVEDQLGAALRVANLRVGGRTYSATERGETAKGMTLITGVPRHGSIAFELPEGSLHGTATLEFASTVWTSTDGVVEVVVDLDDVAVQNDVVLDPMGWPR
ncbi:MULTISPECIES: hypothetical protein [unclassified Microbacterium]|uniref:hypothetical protein n=1 Tax=unclassified Microbacterium TaxID=2609290 RepID=UPI0036560339